MHCAVPATSFRRPRLAARPLTGWRAVLLCLMIALLPVRGWAWASMVAPGAASAQAADLAAITATQDSDTPPCHAHAPAPQAPQEDTSPPHTTHQGCAQCDLCHAGVLPPAVAVWPQARPPHHAPGWFPAPDTGRQGTDGLFRPPRG